MAQTSANLLSPPTNIPPHTALSLAQKGPPILARAPSSSLPWPLSLLFASETPESWTIHENLLLASLRTGDDAAARKLLDRLTTRFGDKNERIIALRGIYEEAVAKDNKELDKVFQNYETILREDPTNLSIRKRRVAVLKALGRPADAITTLTILLDHSPTDVEAWAELSDLYASQGAYSQAIFALEEVLLIMPNAWSAHAQLASLHYLSALTTSPPSLSSLTHSLRHFSRSLELNEHYLRGFYGLRLVTKALGPLLPEDDDQPVSTSSRHHASNKAEDPERAPKKKTVEKLEEVAADKLAEIIRNYAAGKKGWLGYDEAEVIAARELLDREGQEHKYIFETEGPRW